MAEKNNSALFFTCSLIEFIGRKVLQPRKFITDALGKEAIERIYDYADVFHCEPIAILETEGGCRLNCNFFSKGKSLWNE